MVTSSGSLDCETTDAGRQCKTSVRLYPSGSEVNKYKQRGGVASPLSKVKVLGKINQNCRQSGNKAGFQPAQSG